MSSEPKSILDAIKKYKASRGYKLYNFLLNIDYINYVFRNNYEELFNHITKYERATASRQKNTRFKDVTPSRTRRKNYLRKFIKYLHNYCASVYSITEYYKNFLYRDGDGQEWENFNKITKKPLHLFIFGLRNYLTHSSVLPISISIRHSRNKDKVHDKEFLISTRGIFKINKSAIQLDCYKSRSGRYKSRFIRNGELREKFCAYISRNYRGSLSINLKDVISKHRKLFEKHISAFNNKLIREYKSQYNETRKLHKYIIREQSKLLKTD